jgi:predicted dehydrogenase
VAYLTLRLPDGAIAHSHVNWLSPSKVRRFVIAGSKRMVVWDDLLATQRLSVYDRGVDLQGPDITLEDRREALVSYRTGDVVAPALPEREALRGVVEEFVDAIRTGRPAVTDGASGVRVLDVLEAAGRSLDRSGTTVDLEGAA